MLQYIRPTHTIFFTFFKKKPSRLRVKTFCGIFIRKHATNCNITDAGSSNWLTLWPSELKTCLRHPPRSYYCCKVLYSLTDWLFPDDNKTMVFINFIPDLLSILCKQINVNIFRVPVSSQQSVAGMRSKHVVFKTVFSKTVKWFWVIVFSYTLIHFFIFSA